MLRPVIMIAALAVMSCSGRNDAGNVTGKAGSVVSFQPGLWEMRPTITLSQQSDREMPRDVVLMWCIADGTTPRLPNPNETFFGPATVFSSGCYDDLTYEAGRVGGTRECVMDEQHRNWNSVNGRYTPTSFEIEEIVRSQTSAGPREVARIRSTGRRTGDCPRDGIFGDPGQSNAATNAATPAPRAR